MTQETERNLNCPCKKTGCELHGYCQACREHHQNSEGKQMTACEKQQLKRAGKA